MGCLQFQNFRIWPMLYFCRCYAASNIVLYWTLLNETQLDQLVSVNKHDISHRITSLFKNSSHMSCCQPSFSDVTNSEVTIWILFIHSRMSRILVYYETTGKYLCDSTNVIHLLFLSWTIVGYYMTYIYICLVPPKSPKPSWFQLIDMNLCLMPIYSVISLLLA